MASEPNIPPGSIEAFQERVGRIAKLEADNAVMRAALEELCDIVDDPEARKEIDSFTSQPGRQALAAVKGEKSDDK